MRAGKKYRAAAALVDRAQRYAAPQAKDFGDIQVTDGFLDIALGQKVGNPNICGIEVESVKE